MSQREEDCPALSVCESTGNARPICKKGGALDDKAIAIEKCLSGIVLLLGMIEDRLANPKASNDTV